MWPFPVILFLNKLDQPSLQCSNWPQVALVQPELPWWQESSCWVLLNLSSKPMELCKDHPTLTRAAVYILHPYSTPIPHYPPWNVEFQASRLSSDQSWSLPDKVICLLDDLQSSCIDWSCLCIFAYEWFYKMPSYCVFLIIKHLQNLCSSNDQLNSL